MWLEREVQRMLKKENDRKKEENGNKGNIKIELMFMKKKQRENALERRRERGIIARKKNVKL